MARLRDRPTPDLVVMFLAVLVGVLLVGSTLGFILLELAGAHLDLEKLAVRLAEVTNTLIGAIVGYLAGRGVEPKEPPDDDH